LTVNMTLLAVSLLICFSLCFLSANSQACTAGSARGSCINTRTSSCSGQLHTGRCPGASHIRCCTGGGGGGGGNGGGAQPPPAPVSGGGGGGGGGEVGSFPTSLTTSGYTYNGRNAQVLHFLRSRFGANPTTYASHSDGPTHSADLWTSGATGGRDNRNMASMNNLAEYIAGNLRSLGLKYVIWKQRINSGSGWRAMADRGGLTANHYDHVHITFSGSNCSGKNCAGAARAETADQQTLASDSASSAATPTWAIVLLVFAVLAAIATIIVVVMLGRRLQSSAY